MNGKDLAGRTALVTGGGRGIGRAICVRLARAGARVAVNYVSGDETAHETQRMIEADGAECALVKADVSDPDAVARHGRSGRAGARPDRSAGH